MAVGTQVDQAWSLRAAMRRLWTDHVVWTRMYIVAAVGGAPVSEHLTTALHGLVGKVATPLGGVVSLLGTGDAAAVRLLKNQEDIGKAVVPFYGAAAGSRLTDLLKQHILIAVELVSAARSGNQAKFQTEDARWTRNIGEIATLLSGANPNWPKRDVEDLLAQHLSLTKKETVARLQKDWADDVDAFDQIFTEILTVAGVLADGLIKQFPDRYGREGNGDKATALRFAMARLWSDHVIWTRQYIISAVADAPDTAKAAERLLKNQDDIGAAVGSIYGEAAGAKTTELLKQHIVIAVDIVDAAKKKDDGRFKDANDRWDGNAVQIADLLSGANPTNWPRRDVADLLMQHLNLTRKELTAHMHHNHQADVEAFDQILTEILTVADVLATGIIRQFPERF